VQVQFAALACFRTIGRVYLEEGSSYTPYLGYAVVFDDDIDGTPRRRSGPIDQIDASQDQPVERPLSFGTTGYVLCACLSHGGDRREE
jgi:hypothetical protein